MRKRNWKNKKKTNTSIAKERIAILMHSAEDEARSSNFKRANEQAALAWRLAKRYKAPFPKEYKRNICRKCGVFLHPGINCRVRIKKGVKVYYCEACRNFKRVPYKK